MTRRRHDAGRAGLRKALDALVGAGAAPARARAGTIRALTSHAARVLGVAPPPGSLDDAQVELSEQLEGPARAWFDTVEDGVGVLEHTARACELVATADLDTRDRRRALGAFHTPDVVVDEVLARALRCRQGAFVLDPACGAGAFLRGVIRALAGESGGLAVAARVCGIDIDPTAVLAARHMIWLALASAPAGVRADETEAVAESLRRGIVCGDALWEDATHTELGGRALSVEATFPQAFDGARGGFDLVVGNPPFVDAETMMRRWPTHRAAYRARYRTATGNWDLWCPFVERALALTRVGGFHAFVVPNTLASAEYASAVRVLLADENDLLWLRDYVHRQAFGASVYPLAYVVQRRAAGAARVDEATVQLARGALFERAQSREMPRSAFGRGGAPWPIDGGGADWAVDALSTLDKLPSLERLAEVRGAATVAEAYELVAQLSEVEVPRPGEAPVINSGTIDPFVHHWGLRPMRYLGRSYGCPVVRLDGLTPRRASQARTPKVIVAGLTRRVEAVADREGRVVAAKSTTVVIPHPPLDVALLVALLNASPASWYLSQRLSGLAMRGGHLRLGPPQLRRVPVPQHAAETWVDSGAARTARAVAGRLAAALEGERREARHVAALWLELDLAVGELLGLPDELSRRLHHAVHASVS